ncbi:Cof-type HAD-IIB family hydrolase [Aureimonas pseudogalii]|uniref:Cof-type HAD-IIB family hydrolase n=1 Tax=Aureimonas pseudogalii TaxID=1744844 RepID=UPI0035E92F63
MRDLPPAAAGIRLVVSDIDGTLVRDDKSLADETRAAIRRARAAGIAFTLISARPPSGLGEIAAKVEITDEPIGAFNGGALSRRDGTVIGSHRIPEREARQAVEMLDAAGVLVWVFADGQWLAREDADASPHGPRERLASGLAPTTVASFDDALARADKISGVSDDHPLMRRLEAEVAAAIGEAATVVRSQVYFLDVTAKSANKGDGVAFLAETMGVPLHAVAVLGDMPNDVPMFARAGLSVAMGQAPEEVRREAMLVAPTNEENGVARFLDALVAVQAAARRLV